MAQVTLDNLWKRYDQTAAVKDLNLSINDKEFMVFVGPSGCGKTTALRMIAGLEEITEGTVKIGDRVVNDVTARDRDIAMVFQNYALYPHMTVYENMAFGLKLRTLPGPLWQLSHQKEAQAAKKEIEERVTQAAELLGIKQLLHRKPSQLSGGQRQRVALGRAIVRQPQVFLMDEPLSNLDAKMRVQTRAELIRLHRKLGITTIYVTHDQVEAMTMGDRIAVMKDGVLQQCDTPLKIYQEPANMFVAGFVGTPSMNFIPGKLVADSNGNATFASTSINLALPSAKQAALKQRINSDVILGIRPADLFDRNLKNPIEATATNTIDTVVDVCEPMGDISTIYLTIGEQPLVATLPSETKATDGQPLTTVVDTEKLHIFDPESEVSIF